MLMNDDVLFFFDRHREAFVFLCFFCYIIPQKYLKNKTGNGFRAVVYYALP